ncbi:MAG: ABC-type transport auxiliary lipoprotein family protein, partial [Desulfobacterales bacterium]
MAIAIGPVTIPAALDRSQIVTRDGTNKIRLSENHRWAGPLQQDIAAVLADNISGLLKSERV